MKPAHDTDDHDLAAIKSDLNGLRGLAAWSRQDLPDALEYLAAFVAAHPDNVLARAMTADLRCMLFTDLDKAVEDAQFVLEWQPDRAWTRYILGRLFILQGQYDEGIKELEQAIRAEPDNASAHLNLALALWAGPQDYERGLTVARRAEQLAPTDPRPKELIYRNLMGLGRQEEAETLRAHHRLKCDAFPLDPLSIALWEAARESLGAHRFAESFRLFTELTEREPDFLEAFEGLAGVATELRDFKVAEEACLRGLGLAEKRGLSGTRQSGEYRETVIRLRVSLGIALSHTGRHHEAIATLENAYDEQPGPYIGIELGTALVNAGRIEEAVQFYIAAGLDAETAEQSAVYYTNMAVLYERQGEFDESFDYFRKAAAANPSDPQCLVDYATALIDRGGAAEAVRLLTQALEIDPEHAQVLELLETAQRAADPRRPEVRLATKLEKQARRCPLTVEELDRLAQSYGQAGRWVDVLKIWQQAVAIAHDDMAADIRLKLVTVAAGKQLYEFALQIIEEGCRERPLDPRLPAIASSVLISKNLRAEAEEKALKAARLLEQSDIPCADIITATDLLAIVWSELGEFTRACDVLLLGLAARSAVVAEASALVDAASLEGVAPLRARAAIWADKFESGTAATEDAAVLQSILLMVADRSAELDEDDHHPAGRVLAFLQQAFPNLAPVGDGGEEALRISLAAGHKLVAELSPDDEGAHERVYQSLMLAGRAQEAERAIETAIDLFPTSPKLWALAAEVKVNLQSPDAEAVLEYAAQLNAGDPLILGGLALYYGRLGRWTTAQYLLQHAARLSLAKGFSNEVTKRYAQTRAPDAVSELETAAEAWSVCAQAAEDDPADPAALAKICAMLVFYAAMAGLDHLEMETARLLQDRNVEREFMKLYDGERRRRSGQG